MQGDFTRDTFDPLKHFSRVLMQQGRVTVDADANEQVAILLHYMRTLARDLIGPYAAPREEGGFVLTPSNTGGFLIGHGRYYVDGILVENNTDCLYTHQPDYPLAPDDELQKAIASPTGQVFWLYLDVWERLISMIEDPSIREKALGGPDTAVRSKTVWQVKGLKVDGLALAPGGTPALPALPPCESLLSQLSPISKAGLAAQVDPGKPSDDPCVLAPSSQYRGAENQLYRVEIHHGGKVGQATFKWARDNGSRVTAWLGTSGHDLQVGDARGFSASNWVEVYDDATELQGKPGVLVKLDKVEPGVLTVDPASVTASTNLTWNMALINPKVRRWDQVQAGDTLLVEGAVPVRETTPSAPVWIDLEDGVQIQFSAGGEYRTGDYWQIPARVATGNVEWPTAPASGGTATALALPPSGIEHHYAPLGFVAWHGQTMEYRSCRCTFDPGSSCLQLGSIAVGAHLLRPGATLLHVEENPAPALEPVIHQPH